jgi:hypothetical protein
LQIFIGYIRKINVKEQVLAKKRGTDDGPFV